MGEELDPNVIVAQFLQQNIESFTGIAKGILKAGTDKVSLHLNRTYNV